MAETIHRRISKKYNCFSCLFCPLCNKLLLQLHIISGGDSQLIRVASSLFFFRFDPLDFCLHLGIRYIYLLL